MQKKNSTCERKIYMDRWLKLKNRIIIDTHLLLWGDNALSTKLNNSIFFLIFRHSLIILKYSTDVHTVSYSYMYKSSLPRGKSMILFCM